MKIIGITGGIGSGKSEVLAYMKREYGVYVCEADKVARNLQQKGTACYQAIVESFGTEILDQEGELDREKLAEKVFYSHELLEQLNQLVHPAVKEDIREQIKTEREKGTGIFVLEAALLLEDHYDEFCDRIWYVHTEKEIRISRLMKNRGYSREKAEIRNRFLSCR